MIPVRSRSRSSLVLFLFGIQAIVVRTHLLRHKREWVLPPVPLTENQDYTQKEFIAKIRSDRQTEGNVIYSLEGVGANQYPFHLFVVDPHNGNVRVTRKLDREEIPLYKLAGFAKFPNGTEAEEKIDLQIKVIDVNDNAPTFESSVLTAEVDELSPIGTSVITISATDKDDNTTNHAKIAYFIKNQKPRDYFNMNKNGTIYVNSVLDREKEKTVLLTVIGQDMFGAPGGHIATATVTINIRDVNDNPPTLENEAFEGDIEENTSGVEVMRIKAEDMDIDRDNWEAVFEIVQGNENGYFSIKTDPVTNEGILFLEKPVDFEDVKDMNLGLAVRNKAPLVDGSGSAGGANIGFGGGAGGSSGASGSGASGNGATGASGASGASGAGGTSGASGASGAGGAWGSKIKTYPIKINVKNQPEGPHFEPKVRPIPIKEGTPIDVNKVIASYPAIDKDTGKPAEDVKYLKGSDPQNWLSIDPKTAEIKLNKMPDRESPFLVNGVYMAEILCITEGIPSKTATGTVAIQVEDLNDHCPELTRDFIPMCKSNKSIIVNAKDEDAFPNGPPFKFSILPGSTTVNWKMIPYNDTAVVLTTSDNVESVHSNLMLVVEDQQKLSCPKPQKLTVFFCDCTEKDGCSTKGAINWIKPKVSLGPAGIGLLFLGVLAVLIIPLLMIMTQCGSPSGYNDLFVKMPFDTKQHLINYETEGPGDLTESQIKNLPLPSQKSDVQMVQSPGFGMEQSFASMYQGGSSEYRDGVLGMSHWEKSGSHFESEGGQSRGGAATKYFKDMSLPDSYLKGYYNNKLSSGDEKIVQKDHMLVFDYEGTGSSAGSVGCCSNLQQDCDLEFLDNLGPSFKTLAEICGGKIIQTETTQVATPLPNPSANNSQVSVPKLVTSQEIVLPSKVQPAKSTTEQTLICKTSKTTEHAKVRESKATVREGVTSVQTGKAQNQMLVVNQQQPVYFTTAPMLQPIQYVVQQPLQNAMILAETPGHNLQHMVMVNGTDFGSSQGVFVQGQTMMPSAQPQSLGAVLVDSNGIQGTTGNMVHAGNFSGTQNMMVVEGQVPLGTVKVLNGNETSLIQGGTMLNDLLGCQTMLKIGESSSVGQQLQDGRGVFQTAEVTGLQKGHDLSAVESSRTSSNTLSTTHVIHKTAVQYE